MLDAEPMLRTAVEMRSEDIGRVWRKFVGEDETVWQQFEAAYKFEETLECANWYAEAYGGAIIVPVFNEVTVSAEAYKEEYNPRLITGKNALRGWLVFKPHEVRAHYASRVIADVRDPRRGWPEILNVTSSVGGVAAKEEFVFHASWAIPRFGLRSAASAMSHNSFTSLLGLGRVDLIYDYIARHSSGLQSLDSILSKALIDVYKVHGLVSGLDKSKQTGARQKLLQSLLSRVQLTMQSASNNRPIMIDNEKEGFDRAELSTGITGAEKVVDRFTRVLAAAAQIPVTLLLGEQAKGLNNGGDADQQAYYKSVAGYRKRYVTPVLASMDEIVSLSKNVPVPAWEFCKLWEESDAAFAERQEKLLKIDETALQQDIPYARTLVLQRWKRAGIYDITEDMIDAQRAIDGLSEEQGQG